MISPISSSNIPTPQAAQTHNTPAAAKQQPNPPQDQVQLSHQAAGDVDHDGDSH